MAIIEDLGPYLDHNLKPKAHCFLVQSSVVHLEVIDPIKLLISTNMFYASKYLIT